MSKSGELSNEEINLLLFESLRSRGIAPAWASQTSPRETISAECQKLFSDVKFRLQLSDYLRDNPVITQSVITAVAQLAFSAGTHWQHAKPILHDLARQGQHLARWLPTFLLIDGPLGRLLRQAPSPLAQLLKSEHSSFPLLASARDAFNNDLFRKVRNGFAHWSFVWQDIGGSVQIQIFHYETGALDAQVSLVEAEALHYLSTIVIQTLDKELLSKALTTDN
jgi:hypothetical protein